MGIVLSLAQEDLAQYEERRLRALKRGAAPSNIWLLCARTSSPGGVSSARPGLAVVTTKALRPAGQIRVSWVQRLATSRLGPAGGPLAHIIIGSASDDLPSDGAAEGPTYLALRSRGVSSIAHRTRPLPRPKSVRRAPLAHHRQHDFRARASPLHPRMPLAPSHRH